MSTKTKEAPTMEQVAEWEQRLRRDEGRLRWIQGRETELRGGVASLRASGRGDAPEAATLRDELRELRLERQEIEDTLPVLRKRIQEGREAACRAEAAARLVALKRAAGAQGSEGEKDAERLQRAADEYLAALERLNTRYQTILGYRVEGEALAKRFRLPRPGLPIPVAPVQVEAVVEIVRRVEAAGPRRPALHQAERLGPDPESPGAKIVAAAGPSGEERAEQERAAQKKREREEEDRCTLEPFAGEMERAKSLEWAKGGFRG